MRPLRKICSMVLVAVLAGAMLPAASQAGALLGDGSASGGWTASAPDGVTVSLEVLGIVDDTLVLKKTAVFDSLGPIPIQFLKGSSGISKIVIDFEEVTNNSGSAWSSFNLHVLGNAGATLVDFDPTSAANWDGDAFTDPNTLSSNNQSLTLSGGTVANGATFHPGIEAGPNGGNLIINAVASFSLNETPTAGENVIPLPAAAWMGLSGLLGLGVFGQAKKFLRRA